MDTMNQSERWFLYRDQAMQSARANASALIEMGMGDRAIAAKQSWVAKARRYHQLGKQALTLFRVERPTVMGCPFIAAEFAQNGFINTMGD